MKVFVVTQSHLIAPVGFAVVAARLDLEEAKSAAGLDLDDGDGWLPGDWHAYPETACGGWWRYTTAGDLYEIEECETGDGGPVWQNLEEL